MRITISFVLAAVISQISTAEQPNAQQQFFNNMKSQCGQSFVGASTFPTDPDHDFAGKKLVATIKDCTDDSIRIPFVVGEDHSRTWILTLSDQGLLFKHDHRHKDGTPDETTNYGGWANDQGSAWQQFFPADGFTAELIPAASTNVWMFNYDPKTQVLTYDLKRHGKPRYQAKLNPAKDEG